MDRDAPTDMNSEGADLGVGVRIAFGVAHPDARSIATPVAGDAEARQQVDDGCRHALNVGEHAPPQAHDRVGDQLARSVIRRFASTGGRTHIDAEVGVSLRWDQQVFRRRPLAEGNDRIVLE